MISPERRRRPLILVFGAVVVAFVLLATLLPSAQGRRTAVLERKLAVLERVQPPVPLEESPIVVRPESYVSPGENVEPHRYVRVHNFARLGVKLASTMDPLMTWYSGAAGQDEVPSTNLHLAFDPEDRAALRLALAYAVGARRKDDGVINVVATDLIAGASVKDALRHKAVMDILARMTRREGLSATQITELEGRLKTEAANPYGFAPGTTLFEVAGRAYRRRDPKDLSIGEPEIIEALADPKVKLP